MSIRRRLLAGLFVTAGLAALAADRHLLAIERLPRRPLSVRMTVGGPNPTGARLAARLASGAEASAVRKVFARIAIACAVIYVVAYLDRINVGFAALAMNKDLGLSATAFGRSSTPMRRPVPS